MTGRWAAAPPDRRDALIIVNPAVRNLPKPQKLREAEAYLREEGWQVHIQETQGPGDAISLAGHAAASGLRLLFVCGGDGTLNEAANGLAGSDTALAVIPAGTVNIWAREAGFRKEPLHAVRQAARGEHRRIDLGRAGSRRFLLMAGYGLDAAVAAGASPWIKRRIGAAAYAVSALRRAVSYRGQQIVLRLDGKEERAEILMLLAGNTRNYAGLVQITPEAVADDGLLDLCVYTGRGTADILGHALRTILKRHRKSKNVLYRRVKRIELEWRQPLLVQLDGDAFHASPQEITIEPAALWVAVPSGFRSPLFAGPPAR